MALLDKFLKPSLFKPKWQHKDAAVRKQALAKLDDERTLVQVAQHDSDKDVRLLALSKIQSKQYLAEFLVSEHPDLRQQAQQQHLKQLLPNQSIDDLNAINSDNDLVSIASYTQDETLRLAAINNISDESVRLDIACNNPVAKVRLAAAQGIRNSTSLTRLMQIAQGKDKALYRFCKDQLAAAKAIEDAAKALQDKTHACIENAEQLAKSAYSPEYNGRLQLLKQNWSALSEPSAAQSPEQIQRFQIALAQAEATLSQYQAEEKAAAEQLATLANAKKTFIEVLDQLAALEFNADIADQLTELQQTWQQAKAIIKPEAAQEKSFTHTLQAWLSLEHTRNQLIAQQAHINELIAQSQQLEKSSLSKSQNLQKELTSVIKQLPWQPSLVQAELATPELLLALEQALQSVIKHNQNLTAHEADSSKQLAQLMSELETHINEGHLKQANKSHQQAVQALKKISQQEALKFQRQFQMLTAQLSEIRDWQGYAAIPKKEALCANMEALIDSDIDPAILAEKIRDLQEEWKAIGPIAGKDDKILWNRFRTAADAAYEPCKAYYADMAVQRQQNLENRQALIAQLIDYEANMDWDNADWGIVQKTLDAARATFRSFSPVERSEHKNSQASLQLISDKIYAHIKAEYQRNIESKEALIAQAIALQEVDDLTQAIERSKELQAQWKTVGITPNKADQKLWQEFRSACNQVFSRRDEQRQQNKAQLESNIELAQTLVEQAETTVAAATDAFKAEHKEALQQYQAQFATLNLPKAIYAKLRQRLADAQQGLEETLVQAKVAKKQQAWFTLADKLMAISLHPQDSEKAISLYQPQEDEYTLPQGIDKSLLDNKWQAITCDGQVELSSADALRDACIGLEILAELDSPSEDQAARMAYQVQRLAQGLGQAGSLQEQVMASITQWLSLNANHAWQQRYNQALLALAKK